MRYYLAVLVCLVALSSNAQGTGALRTYTFASAEALQREEPRPYLVFIRTDWCRYCRGMEKNTFNDPRVIELLNERYYFVSLDGEAKEDIEFAGRTFAFKPTGAGTGVQELAEALGSIDGRLAFPTTVILSPDREIDFQYGAFLAADSLLEVIGRATE